MGNTKKTFGCNNPKVFFVNFEKIQTSTRITYCYEEFYKISTTHIKSLQNVTKCNIINAQRQSKGGQMDYITKAIVGYAEKNYKFSKFELAKLKYMLEVIILNIAEIVIIGAFFMAIGRRVEFFIALGVLMSTRTFAGGFHLKSFLHCFILTAVVFVSTILILPSIDIMTNSLMEVLLIITIVINVALAPVSKRKSGQSPQSRMAFKCVSTVILLMYALFLLNTESPYAEIITWTLVLQSLQLIIGKGMILYEKVTW